MTEESMIERLSKLFAAREGWDWDKLDRLEDTSFGWGQNHIRQQVFENIRSMREPSNLMEDCGISTFDDLVGDNNVKRSQINEVWRAMTDAALAKP